MDICRMNYLAYVDQCKHKLKEPYPDYTSIFQLCEMYICKIYFRDYRTLTPKKKNSNYLRRHNCCF